MNIVSLLEGNKRHDKSGGENWRRWIYMKNIKEILM